MPDSPTNEDLAAEIERLRGELEVATLTLGEVFRLVRAPSEEGRHIRIRVNEFDDDSVVAEFRREGRLRFTDRLMFYFPDRFRSRVEYETGHDDPPDD